MRIVWTNNERALIEKRLRKLVQDTPPNTATLLQLLRIAMEETMPENRWRTISCVNEANLTEAWATKLKAIYSEPRADPSTLNGTHHEPEPAAVTLSGPPKPLPPMPDPDENELKRTTAALITGSITPAIASLARSIVETVLAQVQDQLTDGLYQIVREEASKQRRPKVLVLGPKADQQNILKRDFGELLTLKFVASDELRRAGDLAKAYPHVLVWTDFCSHAETQHINHKTFVSGGMSALRDALTGIYAAQ